MPELHIFTQENIAPLINKRSGEIKAGEQIACLTSSDNWAAALQLVPQQFVILGIPEDIGVRANGGIGGAHTAWLSFLKSFLNLQGNSFFLPETLLLLGAFELDEKAMTQIDGLEVLRQHCAQLDDLVFPVIETIVAAGKIPIVIGGGHNNAFPIIKGCSKALNKGINAVNLDAHADYRNTEGRHSGNGFRYAKEENFLKRYCMFGLHEAYNNQDMITAIQHNDDLLAIWWEDVFLREQLSWNDAIQQAMSFVSSAPFGVELDLDCIENTLSSAITPVGISAQQAMRYLYACGKHPNARYLHLPEGVVQRQDGQLQPLTGKLLSYLVQAFLKGKWETLANKA